MNKGMKREYNYVDRVIELYNCILFLCYLVPNLEASTFCLDALKLFNRYVNERDIAREFGVIFIRKF